MNPTATSPIGLQEASPGASLPKVGTAPVNWNNCELPDWSPYLPFPAILDEMAAAGYAGTEHDIQFPNDPAILRSALAERGLTLCASYQWLRLSAELGIDEDLAALDEILDMLVALGCDNLVVSDAATAERVALAGHVPDDNSAGLDEAAWERLARNLTVAAARAATRGVRTHYHNHVGTYVETPAEVDRLVSLLPRTGADLCFDTGHYAYGGGDPAAFVRRHRDQIGHLHMKDVDPAVLAEARANGWSFVEALRHVIFAEFGEGMVDIPAVVAELRAVGFAGWVIVEQDTSRRPPTESATASRRFLRERCGI